MVSVTFVRAVRDLFVHRILNGDRPAGPYGPSMLDTCTVSRQTAGWIVFGFLHTTRPFASLHFHVTCCSDATYLLRFLLAGGLIQRGEVVHATETWSGRERLNGKARTRSG